MEHPEFIIYKGEKYRLSRFYYYEVQGNKRSNFRKSLHRRIWEEEHSTIPKGYHIHHIDGNKFNNSLTNLQLISASEHIKHHQEELSKNPSFIQHRTESLIKAREEAKEWHSSAEWKKWHIQHYSKNKEKLYQVHAHYCIFCKKEYFSPRKKKTKFCHVNCREKHNRRTNLEKRKCIRCSTERMVFKYSKVLH